MKDTVLTFILLCVLLGAPHSLFAQSKNAPLRAGAAAVEITPRVFPIKVRGRVRNGAHDAIHARSLVLSDGRTTIAMCVVDALGTGPETCDEIRRIAAEKCDISPRNILIASTHAHSVPSSGVTEGDHALVDYRQVFL